MKTRIPRNKRVEFAPRMVLTERDKRIIFAVYENRYMSRDQITALFFGAISVANLRLMKLYQHGYLDRIFKPVSFGSTQAAYGLDRKGAELVTKELSVPVEAINWKKRNAKVEFLFLEHTLAISEFRVYLEWAVRDTGDVEFVFWKSQGRNLNDRVADPDGKSKYLVVSPDAFFGLASPGGKSYFFLEVDLGTESGRRITGKVGAYRQYWKSGKYQERYGFKSFRVLTVTTTEKRLNNLLKTAKECGAKNMFLFAKFTDLTRIFDPIWQTPSGAFVSLIE